MPFAGVGRAIVVIARCAIWSKDDLSMAHKAGALYTLVKVTDGRTRAEPNITSWYTFLRWRSQPQA